MHFGVLHRPAMHNPAQVVPQPPQFAGSVLVSVHVPVQTVRPVPHVHALATHLPAPHDFPHVPQLSGSVVLSVQSPAHASGALAGQPHTLALHVAPLGQILPHAPQFVGSVVLSVHTNGAPEKPPPHSSGVAVGQLHAPLTHVADAGHALPQPPQFAGSVELSMHMPLQMIRPVPHAQMPALHVPPLAHAFPHLPQFAASVVVSVQTAGLPHEVGFAAGQASHTPLVHVAPVGQGLPQPPQFAGSVETSTQSVPQVIFPVPHTQTPAVQTAPPAHALPQSPQFALSVAGSMHAPLQTFFGGSHLGGASAMSRGASSITDVSLPRSPAESGEPLVSPAPSAPSSEESSVAPPLVSTLPPQAVTKNVAETNPPAARRAA